MRLEDDRLEVEIPQGGHDEGPYFGPVQPAEAASQRWHGDRVNAASADLVDQRLQSCVDILDAALAAPVPFGRKVDNVFRIREKAGFEHEHPTGLHFPARTGGLVGLEVLRCSRMVRVPV